MKNKSNKRKKILVIALLLFAISSLVGYGVYSYYWTEGNFTGVDSVVEIAAFDPQTTIDDSTDFLGSGGTLHMSCPDSTTGNESMNCTGTVLVSNNGDRDITVEVLDASSDKYTPGDIVDPDSFDLNVSSPSFNWTSTTISAGDSAILNIAVPITVTSDYGSSTPVDAGSSWGGSGSEIFVETSFKLKASQVH